MVCSVSTAAKLSSTLTDSHKGGKAGISAAPGKHAHHAGPADGCTVDRGGPNYEHVRNGMQGIIRSQTAADKQHDLPAVSHLCFAPLSVYGAIVMVMMTMIMYAIFPNQLINSIQHKGLALLKRDIDQVLVTLVCMILTYCIKIHLVYHRCQRRNVVPSASCKNLERNFAGNQTAALQVQQISQPVGD